MGQVLHSGQGSRSTLTGLTPSTRHPVSTTSHQLTSHVHAARHLEFILPDELCRSPEARAQCSQHLGSLFDTEFLAGQQGRLLHHHNPTAMHGSHLLSLHTPQQSRQPADTNHHSLIACMVQRGFAVRLLDVSEVPCAQSSLHHTLLHRHVTLITLQCGPETTHPHITTALREALDHQHYFYVLDFQCLPDRDAVTNSAHCLYNLNLVMPDATKHAIRRAQDALFEMNGALGDCSNHRLTRWGGLHFPSPTRLTHLGSTYTIADLIPA